MEKDFNKFRFAVFSYDKNDVRDNGVTHHNLSLEQIGKIFAFPEDFINELKTLPKHKQAYYKDASTEYQVTRKE